MSFAYGSASLVQVIKLMEPMETILLTAAANTIWFGCPHGVVFTKVISVLIIFTGISLLLVQKSMKVNPYSILFTISSGFAMASRNVVLKIDKESRTDGTNGNHHPKSPNTGAIDKDDN